MTGEIENIMPMHTQPLKNSTILMAFALKRDRIWLPSWLIAVILFAIAFAPIFPEMAGTEKEVEILAETMKSPIMIALTGPVYGDEYTYGIMFIQIMLVWSIILVASMNILFVVRHTRKDEEDGRIELLRALPVGKSSNLFSVVVLVILVNLIIALVCGFGLAMIKIEGMDFAGCILFGFALGACGLFFAAVAALAAQLASSANGASGLSFVVLGLFYLIRAAGDLENEAISLFTPFGLAGRVQYFYMNDVWPLLILLIAAIIIFVIAFRIYEKRDLGASLIAEKNGREHAKKSLNNFFGLAFRLTKNTLIAWAVIIFIFAASYGSLFGDLTLFYESNELFKALMGVDGASEDMMMSFVSTIMLIMSLIAVIPILSITLRLRAEEKKERLEQIYANAVSKQKSILAYFGIAVIAVVVMQVLCAVGLWIASVSTLENPIDFEVFIIAAINFVPPMLIFAGLSVLLTGVFPKVTFVSWLYLVYCFVVSYLGDIINLPGWAMKISVFGLLPHYPADEFEIIPWIALIIIACILTAIGVIAYRKRDLAA